MQTLALGSVVELCPTGSAKQASHPPNIAVKGWHLAAPPADEPVTSSQRCTVRRSEQPAFFCTLAWVSAVRGSISEAGGSIALSGITSAKGMAGESNQGLQAEIQCYQAQWRNIACVHLFKCWYTCTNKTHTDMYTHVYIHTYVRTYIHVNQQVHTHILAYIK